MTAPNPSAMLSCEHEIMDLWDAGVPITEIAHRTGKPLDYVRKIVSRFDGGQAPNQFDKMVRAGTASLLAAIRCFHPEVFTKGHP